MFLLLPLVVLAYHNNKAIGNVVVMLLAITGLVVSFVMCYNNEVKAYILPHIMPYGTTTIDTGLKDYFNYAYFPTYTRFATYYLGACFGYYFYQHSK